MCVEIHEFLDLTWTFVTFVII